MEKTSNNILFDHHIYGPAGTTFPEFVENLLSHSDIS